MWQKYNLVRLVSINSIDPILWRWLRLQEICLLFLHLRLLWILKKLSFKLSREVNFQFLIHKFDWEDHRHQSRLLKKREILKLFWERIHYFWWIVSKLGSSKLIIAKLILGKWIMWQTCVLVSILRNKEQ